ncbi:MAG: SpoVR family protein, partial [Candidatus Macondimonas sp.]
APTADTLGFRDRFAHLPGSAAAPARAPTHAPIPPNPESDLLWFIAHYAPDLEGWERDILLAVREESFYFQPIFACQIMNEGWASYWHARLLREARFLPSELYVDAIKTHSDVVRPYAGEAQVALQVNPYHLGFCLWEHIIEHHGMAAARRIMATEDDFGFVRNYLDEELAQRLGLFQYTTRRRGREATVSDWDLDALKESLLAPKYHFGAPHVEVREMRRDGTLVLQQDHALDKRGLDVESARKVLEYMHGIWRRPVVLYSINGQGKEARIAVGE